MSSTLGCIGLGVTDESVLASLIDRLLPDATLVAEDQGLTAMRWRDTSGASLTLTVRGEELLDLVPSYVAQMGVRLGGLAPYGGYVCADVLEHGETVTRIACDLAQSLISEAPVQVDASVTALGVEMSLHADETAFAASDASILGERVEGTEPTRYAAESLLAYGLLGKPEEAEPFAFLSGTVLSSMTQTNAATGQTFHAVRVRTVGFTATVCLSSAEHPIAPEPGNVIAGTCYLVLDVPTLW